MGGSFPTSRSSYRWRLGDIEITRVLEFEAALFEPAVIHPDVTERQGTAISILLGSFVGH
jgi:hypothetical protein